MRYHTQLPEASYLQPRVRARYAEMHASATCPRCRRPLVRTHSGWKCGCA